METLKSGYKLRTLRRSTIAISSVVLVEVILGLIVNSLAIVSDGLHALLDALTSFLLFVATRMSVKPPDEEHMYGHEKFESVGGLIGGLALLIVALVILYEAVLKTVTHQTVNVGIEYVGFVAVGYTFCIDFFRVGTLMRARRSESVTMKLGFYHAMADMASTVTAFVGFALATLGLSYGDSLASMVLGVLLTYLSVRLVWSSGMELTDTVSKGLANKVRKTILGTDAFYRLEDLKIRKAGEKTFVRATLQVPDYMDLEAAHGLASDVEAKIKNMLGNAEVAIHTEPWVTEMPTEKLVEKLATEVAGVKEAHEVDVAYAGGKLYVTLHVYVDPKLSVEEAHEIAEEIEMKIGKELRSVEDVAVHVEPLRPGKRRGAAVDEAEIRKIVRAVVDSYQQVFRVKRIVTYIAGKKQYINIDCSFTGQVSIEKAHEIASQVEEQVKEHFAETTVMVHMEPS